MPKAFAGQRDARAYSSAAARAGPKKRVVFEQLSDALAWAEDRVLAEHDVAIDDERPIELLDMEMFQGRKADTVAHLLECVESRTVRA
ncbi:MAG: hypothetical protein U0235_00215 [Polyangiaceae bacterium]